MSRQNAEYGPEERILGIAWYRRDQWPLLLATAADRSNLEETYDEWLTAAQQAIADMRSHSQGVKVIKVPVYLEDLFEWCIQEGRAQDRAARASYVSKKLWEMRQTQ